MEQQTKHFYEFADFRIDPEARVLLHGSRGVPLTPKVFDPLLSLVEHRTHIISKDELMKFVRLNDFVEEGNLTQNISMLRKLRDESPNAPQFIETVPCRGYRFVAPVQEVTPDGQWLVYVTTPHSLAKAPVAGGPQVQLTNGLSWRSTVSPDGKWIAYNRLEEASGQWHIAVIPIDDGAPPKIFDAPSPNVFRALRWTPDGRGIAYPVTSGSVSNIWSQPLDGGASHQMTNFKDQLIFDFAWSRDGKQLALSRGGVNSDVVVISNFR